MGDPKKPKRPRSLFKEPLEGKTSEFDSWTRQKIPAYLYFARIDAFSEKSRHRWRWSSKRKSIFEWHDCNPHFYGFANLDFIDFLFYYLALDFYQYLDRYNTKSSEMIRLSHITNRSFFFRSINKQSQWITHWLIITQNVAFQFSTLNENVARFARIVECDFFCAFQTPWLIALFLFVMPLCQLYFFCDANLILKLCAIIISMLSFIRLALCLFMSQAWNGMVVL